MTDIRPMGVVVDNWELISPNGLFLEFGPGACWQIGDAKAKPLQPSVPRP